MSVLERLVNVKVCLATSTLDYPVGGHFWVSLNWALGLRSFGCDVVWLEQWDHNGKDAQEIVDKVTRVIDFLDAQQSGLSFALVPRIPDALTQRLDSVLTIEDVADADVLLSLDQHLEKRIVERFSRSALVDLDSGLTQSWIKYGVSQGWTNAFDFSRYDVLFTIGEGVPRVDAGYQWEHVFPCVALDHWPVTPA